MSAELAVVESKAPTLLESGIYENLSFEDYSKQPGLNGSKIVNMRRSPMKYKYERDTPSEGSNAMALGIMTHRLILEPHLAKDFAVWGTREEEKVRRGKVWDAFQDLNAGRPVVTVAERDQMVGMAEAALRNQPIKKYAAQDGPTEVSLFWNHPHTGRRFKCRLDKFIPSTFTIFDLKTTRDCHSYRFGGQAYALAYHIKMAIQYDGVRTLLKREPQVILGAVDSKPPHESAVYRVTKDVLLQGLEELASLVNKLDECEKSGEWPGEYATETDLLLPTWAMNDEFADVT